MENMKGTAVWGTRLFTAVLIALIWYLSLKYVAVWILPFIIAYGIAYPAKKLPEIWHITNVKVRGIISVACVTVFLILLGILSYYLGRSIIGAGIRLVRFMTENPEFLTDTWHRITDSLFGWLETTPFLPENASVDGWMQGILTEAVGRLAENSAGAVTRLPQLFFSIMITVIATYFIVTDNGKAGRLLKKICPTTVMTALTRFKDTTVKAVLVYLRSYILIFTVNVITVFLGLLLLQRPYALPIAFVCAVIDLFPILGIGSTLIPWGVYLCVTGEIGAGIGILLLYLLLTVIRQWLEPHLVGKGIGLPPIVTLIAMVLGARLFGVLGMLLSPLSVITVKEILVNDE